MKKLLKIAPGQKENLTLEEGKVMVEIGEGAEVEVVDAVSGEKCFVLDKDASLRLKMCRVDGGKDDVTVELKGEGSEVTSEVVFLGREGEQDLRIVHRHVGRHTRSRMLSKGAVVGRSRSYVVGTIRMEPGCSGADGILEERNLLLSDEAKIDAQPNLEIRHDDVKASHAATVERVDDEKLFYLASRGIPQKEAKRLIVEGFFGDALPERILKKLLTSL